jgi:hypothetical protein
MDLEAIGTRTLEQLDGEEWPEPNATDTELVRECHRLRRVPVGDLTKNDLRTLIGQQIGIAWLVPLALGHLEQDPLAGELYPGDLLNAVLRCDPVYWNENAAQLMSLWRVRDALEQLQTEASKLLARPDWPSFG